MKRKGFFEKQRKLMIETQLLSRGITNPRVIGAMKNVPREKFVLPEMKNRAYDDCALPLAYGQTISQPYIVALMCQLLKLRGREKVLDVGTGSGYQAAVLSLLAKKVVSIERIPQLAKSAAERLRRLGYSNVKVVTGDGSKGVVKEAPFDAIVSAAAVSEIPKAWQKQLKDGGRLVFPLKKRLGQQLTRITKKNNRFFQEDFGSVVFVPLVAE
jgi:protein-L-isoaspartate(D-aspartate) O-methyltransferase